MVDFEYADFYQGFLKGMEDIEDLVRKNDPKAYELPSMGNWDYDILTSMYSVGYYEGYVYNQKKLLQLEDDINIEKIIKKAYDESYIPILKP